ncbi:excinuclease ABC subunit UvrC [Methanohalophilus halophilus]|uniref:UvrABC system protein C n=1 Tax=Methanohalophilus halophilus TaxID=2177 RepID=A0A1L3Q1Y7_9EURY|nr:excinuclease ABC subunit UvrC [Methanohalophilus halophilus]APH38884.1 excinuclease ABC subunit C [Methanohalophilus halophilus]RNI07489.1 excinuclease ABC subunit UvrC [Methanohalophilus halophilus]SDW68235.1 Excinuclease ABC subunit C [Methanohalophilus halophilus]
MSENVAPRHPDISDFPHLPGVYLMKDANDTIIYIGKARDLKKRVSQYFQTDKNKSPKTKVLVSKIRDIEYIVTSTEVEALILEANLIKKNRPRYNISLKDDKRYPYVKVTVNSRYPRIYLVRRRLMDDAVYFGPYTSVKPVRTTLDLISQIFKIRRCHGNPAQKKRPCLNYHINRCMGPCTGDVDAEEYRDNVKAAVKYLRGDTGDLLGKLRQQMQEYAEKQRYEAASVIRDQIEGLRELAKQQRTTAGIDDRDVIGLHVDEKDIYVQLFYVRSGNMVGRADFELNRGKSTSSEIIAEFIKQYYQDSPVPPEIVVPEMPPEEEVILKWLSEKAGRKVTLNIPRIGEKKKLLDMAMKNATMARERTNTEKAKKEGTLKGLETLQEKLGIGTLPRHIEGFDISNISGSDPVASMVVFKNGTPSKADYRHYNIKGVEGIDDFAMMAEAVDRRYSRMKEDKQAMPDLILIDGGEGQVNAANRELQKLQMNIPVIGLAKKFEHIIFPDTHPRKLLILPKKSPALKILMQIRDEAHRFAVASHRKRRSARLSHSELDGIEGIGEKKKKELLQHFGSVEKVREAEEKEIAEIEGIGKALSRRIAEKLREQK